MRVTTVRQCVIFTIGWTCIGIIFVYLQTPVKNGVVNMWLGTTSNTQHQQQTSITNERLNTRLILPTPPPPISSDNQFQSDMRNEAPHLPLKLLPMKRSVTMSYNKTCALLPSLFDIKVNNIYWQHLVTKDGINFYLYRAYYDDRQLTEGNYQVRILGMVDRIPPPVTFCQFWYEKESKPVFAVENTTFLYIWYKAWGNSKDGDLQPVLLSCPLPKNKKKIPIAVSLVENICDNATNALSVFIDKNVTNVQQKRKSLGDEDKPSVAVCVKGLNFLHDDRSFKLVEWLELLEILGADKVFLYDLGIHPNILKVLRHYETKGFVDVQRITLPGDQLNLPHLRALFLNKKVLHKRQNEVIPYNDCLYRNIYIYDYVVLLDTDEVIVPAGSNVADWQQLIKTADEKDQKSTKSKRKSVRKATMQRRSSICAQNVYFFDNMTDSGDVDVSEIPKYMHMLSHVRRSHNFTKPGQYVKCFHETGRVLTLHNHYPISCGYSKKLYCPKVFIEVEDGRLQHYRTGCTMGLEKSCQQNYMNHTIVDDTLWRYKDEMISRTKATLKSIGLLP